MKKFFIFFLFISSNLIILFANNKKNGLEINLRQISIHLNSTEIKNSNNDFSSARLNTDSEMHVQGKLDFITNYFFKKFLWANSLISEYGKSYIEPRDKEKYETENVDKILLNTDLTQRIWNIKNLLGGFELGPFISMEYETEFNKSKSENYNKNLKKILRSKLGLKIFEGKYLKDLYLAFMEEEDYTYKTNSNKTGYEAGYNIVFDIKEGMKFFSFLNYRDYLSRNTENVSDLDYELEAEIRLDIKLLNEISLVPTINYYKASLKNYHISADNLYIGLALSYSKIFKKAN